MVLKTEVLAVCLLLIPIVMSWKEGQEMIPELEEETRQYGHGSPPPPEKPCSTICKGTKSNRTINTRHGKVFCLVPTMDEMIEHLNKIGGYNRHYVAITQEEAEANFVNLLPKEKKPTTTLPKCRTSYKHSHKGRGRGCGRGRGRGRGFRLKLNNFKNPSISSDANAKDIGLNEMRKTQADSSVNCLTPKCLSGGSSTVKGYLTCPTCQRCRKLENFLFPEYVNEVTCDDSPSGYSKTIFCTPAVGECKQNVMTIDVLSRENDKYQLFKQEGSNFYYKQVWEKKTIQIKSCCECFASNKYKK